LLKHIGRIKGSDSRCVVVMLEIPEREDHALVIAGNIHPRLEQNVMTLLQSPEGQQEKDFANLLSRRFMDDTKKSVFNTLHEMNLLTAIPHDRIVMTPRPDTAVPLSDIIAAMRAQATGSPMPEAALRDATSDTKFNQFVENNSALAGEQKFQMAQNLLFEAGMMDADAAEIRKNADFKRRQAYALAPELEPASDTAVLSMKDQPTTTPAE